MQGVRNSEIPGKRTLNWQGFLRSRTTVWRMGRHLHHPSSNQQHGGQLEALPLPSSGIEHPQRHDLVTAAQLPALEADGLPGMIIDRFLASIRLCRTCCRMCSTRFPANLGVQSSIYYRMPSSCRCSRAGYSDHLVVAPAAGMDLLLLPDRQDLLSFCGTRACELAHEDLIFVVGCRRSRVEDVEDRGRIGLKTGMAAACCFNQGWVQCPGYFGGEDGVDRWQ